jgi:bifunctional DNA-binding transcriptional regulator/antitoxin component of YhaV-PrlF toxin-antitoxin module
MAFVSYVGKLLKDGHLSLPKKAREELKLEAGQEVDIIVHTRNDAQQLPDEAYAPLRKLIGLAKTGKLDASVHHDKYLYGKEEA